MENLDAMQHVELLERITAYKNLSQYCELRWFAYHRRLEGKIEEALRYEKKMDALYKKLPQWAKW